MRMYFLQHGFNLSDPAAEEALYDSISMRNLVGIDLGREAAPDETTLYLIEQNDLGARIFEAVHAHLDARGVKISKGYDCRCHDHRGPVIDQEQGPRARPGHASDEEGQSVAFRHQGAYRCRQQNQGDPRRRRHSGECAWFGCARRSSTRQGNPRLGRPRLIGPDGQDPRLCAQGAGFHQPALPLQGPC